MVKQQFKRAWIKNMNYIKADYGHADETILSEVL